MEFRQSENPVQACRYILEHSESLPARFQVMPHPGCLPSRLNFLHLCIFICVQCASLLMCMYVQAALTLREAALRAWAITPAQERQQLRSYILHFIVRWGCLFSHLAPFIDPASYAQQQPAMLQEWECKWRCHHIPAVGDGGQHAEEGLDGYQQRRAACILHGS